MGLSEELAASLSDPGEPDVNIDEGTIDGKAYEEPSQEFEHPEDDIDWEQAETEEGEAQKAEDKAEEEPEEKPEDKQDVVPLAALHEERKRRQELESVVHELQKQMQGMHIQEPAKEPSKEPTVAEQMQALGPMPDPVTDREEFESWLTKRDEIRDTALTKQAEAQTESEKRAAEERQFQQTINHAVTQISQLEERAREQHPEYDEALTFMRDKYVEQQREAGRVGTDAQFINEAKQFEAQIGVQAILQGRDPTALVLQLASHNGYKYEPKPDGDEDPNPEGKENMERLNKIEQGQQRSKSAGPTGKAATPDGQGETDDDFDAAMAQFLSGVGFDMPNS